MIKKLLLLCFILIINCNNYQAKKHIPEKVLSYKEALIKIYKKNFEWIYGDDVDWVENDLDELVQTIIRENQSKVSEIYSSAKASDIIPVPFLKEEILNLNTQIQKEYNDYVLGISSLSYIGLLERLWLLKKVTSRLWYANMVYDSYKTMRMIKPFGETLVDLKSELDEYLQKLLDLVLAYRNNDLKGVFQLSVEVWSIENKLDLYKEHILPQEQHYLVYRNKAIENNVRKILIDNLDSSYEKYKKTYKMILELKMNIGQMDDYISMYEELSVYCYNGKKIPSLDKMYTEYIDEKQKVEMDPKIRNEILRKEDMEYSRHLNVIEEELQKIKDGKLAN